MDNLTHSLVGLFLARAGFNRLSSRAAAICVVAANAPDFDVAMWFAGQPALLHWHRHITHALVAMPLMALLSVVIVRLAGRKAVRWLPAFGMALAAVASHVALDMTNIYGVRLLLPFSGQWFQWDLTPVVDVTIWAILALGLVIPVLSKLIGSEIGERRRQHAGTGAAILALLLLTAYDGARAYLHRRGLDSLRAEQVTPEVPLRTALFPTGNPLVWTGMLELPSAWASVPVDLREDRIHTVQLRTAFKAEVVPAMEAAWRHEYFGVLQEFIQYPLWTVEAAPDVPGASRVTLFDLRFGAPTEPGFASARAIVDTSNRVVSAEFGADPRTVRPR